LLIARKLIVKSAMPRSYHSTLRPQAEKPAMAKKARFLPRHRILYKS
jgi:hypothetical protein